MSADILASPRSAAFRLNAVLRWTGWAGLAAIGVTVSLSDFLAQAPAGMRGVGAILQAPSASLPFGTDMLGRDMLSETLHGLDVSVESALLAAAVAVIAGGLAGFVAARLPDAVRAVLRWAAGILASVPALLLAILIIGILSRDFAPLAAGLAAAPIAFVRAFDRARRDEESAHAEYARATGISPATLLRRDLVYEFRDNFLETAARALAATAITLSTASFLGFAAEPPHRDLGLMIAAARASYLTAWWTVVFPALALMALILFARLAAGLDEGERP
jgi:peptide/nickel transport system permease protein